MKLINPSIAMTTIIWNSPAKKNWMLSLALKDGEQLKAKAKDILSRKNVEYLAIDLSGETRELRLDHIASFSHPELGTVVVSEE